MNMILGQRQPLYDFVEEHGVEKAIGVRVAPKIALPQLGDKFEVVSVKAGNKMVTVRCCDEDRKEVPEIPYNIHMLQIVPPRRG